MQKQPKSLKTDLMKQELEYHIMPLLCSPALQMVEKSYSQEKEKEREENRGRVEEKKSR